jgi:hypothetical protein
LSYPNDLTDDGWSLIERKRSSVTGDGVGPGHKLNDAARRPAVDELDIDQRTGEPDDLFQRRRILPARNSGLRT